MADRTLTWYHQGGVRGDESRTGETYYLDVDYEPVAVRIHAETAPDLGDAQFDIRADGVSIFANQTPEPVSTVGRIVVTVSTAYASIPKGDNV